MGARLQPSRNKGDSSIKQRQLERREENHFWAKTRNEYKFRHRLQWALEPWEGRDNLLCQRNLLTNAGVLLEEDINVDSFVTCSDTPDHSADNLTQRMDNIT
jgi:hypothetical protein